MRFIRLNLRSILIKNNQLKIGNFSIYKTLTHQPVKLKTSTHTSAYTAPEIIDNEEYTVKSDIWYFFYFVIFSLIQRCKIANSQLIQYKSPAFTLSLY